MKQYKDVQYIYIMSSLNNITVKDLIKICDKKLKANMDIIKLTYEPGFYFSYHKNLVNNAFLEYDTCINNIKTND